MHKKFLALAMGAAMVFSLAACTQDNTTENSSNSTSIEDIENTDNETTDTETPSTTEDEATGDVIEVSTLADIVDGLAAQYPTTFAANNPLEGEMLEQQYPGLAELCSEVVVYQPMISATTCEIAMVTVSEEANIDKVIEIMQARIDYQIGDETNPGGAWYPASIEAWELKSEIVVEGNNIMLLAWDTDEAEINAAVDMFTAVSTGNVVSVTPAPIDEAGIGTSDEDVMSEVAVDETAVDETAVDETAVDETAVDETAVDETAVDETAVDETAE